MPESSQNNYPLDAGIRQHDGRIIPYVLYWGFNTIIRAALPTVVLISSRRLMIGYMRIHKTLNDRCSDLNQNPL